MSSTVLRAPLGHRNEQTEIDDEISDQLKEDAGSRHDIAIMPQIPSGFGQNRGTLFLRRTAMRSDRKGSL